MRISRVSLHGVSVALALLFATAVAEAQLPTGTITGTVQDATGAVIPGVSVALSNPGIIGGNQQAATNERGVYQFTRLVPGIYGVKAELPGFRAAVRQNVTVNADVTVRVDLTLEVGALSDTVTVTGEAPLLDTTTALNQAVLDRQVLDKLPTGNDLWSIGRMVPGVLLSKYDVGGSESFQQSGMSVHGSASAEKKYAIDGMDVAWAGGDGGAVMVYFDSMMFQEINYQVGSISAENAQGGIVMNMVTKTGSNDFHGNFNFVGSDSRLNANNVTDTLRRELLAGVPARVLAANPNIEPGNKILSIFDSAATFSGPIVRDKLWFTGSGRLQALNQLQVGSYNPDGTQFVDDNRIKNGSIKVSWQVTPSSQLHYTYSRNLKFRYHRIAFAGATFIEQRASRIQAQPADIHQLKWTATLSPKMVMDVGASLQEGPTPYKQQKEVKPGDIPRLDLVTLVGTVAAPTYDFQPQYKGVLNASLSYFAGKHDLKIGYQFGRSMDRRQSYSTSHFPSGLVARYSNSVPNSVVVYNTPYDYRAYWHDNAWYVQDKWTPMRKLTLNLGLRVQKTNGWVPAVCQQQTIFVNNSQCFSEIKNVPDWLDVAPRMALVYDVFGDGKTAVKMSANRYNVGIGSGHQFRVNPVSQATNERPWTDRNGDLIPQLDELGVGTGFNFGSTNRYSPDLKRPFSNELSFEVERQLFGDIVVTAGYYHRETRRNIGSKNLAVPRESYIPLTVTERNSRRTVTVFNQNPALRGRFDTLWDNFSELDSQYNGIDVSFQKRLSNRWMVMGGFSYGRNHGDTFGATNQATNLNNPNNQFRRGVIDEAVPYSFKTSGLYELPFGISLSGNFQHFTGFPESDFVRVTSTTQALTQGNTDVRIAPRGTNRLPNNNILDMSVKKEFRIGERLKLEPTLDMFNLTNGNSVQNRVTQLGPTYHRANSILRGRMWRLGFSVDF